MKNCPECNSVRLRVVLTRPCRGGEIIRRRVCLNCKHRYYTVQEPEKWLSPFDIAWDRRNPVVRKHLIQKT